MRILFIDTSDALFQKVTEIFQKYHHEFTLAATCPSALGLLRNQVYDLIISEIHFPEMDFFDFYKELEEYQTQRPSVIVFSEDIEKNELIKLLNTEVRDFIEKGKIALKLPISLMKIENYLKKQKSRVTALVESTSSPTLTHSSDITSVFSEPKTTEISEHDFSVQPVRSSPSHEGVTQKPSHEPAVSSVFAQKSKVFLAKQEQHPQQTQQLFGGSQKSNQLTVVEAVKLLRARLKKGQISLPNMNNIANDFMKIMSEKEASVDAIIKVLEKDQNITAQVIKQANSSYYQGMSKISSIRDALVRLGNKTVNSIVQTHTQSSFYNISNPKFKETLEKMWHNTIATSYIGRRIGEKLKAPISEELYLAGMFFNVGECFLVKLVSEIPELQGNTRMLQNLVEKFHIEFGNILLEAWQFNPFHIQVEKNHHKPSHELNLIETEDKNLVIGSIHILNLAYKMSFKMGYMYFPDDDFIDRYDPKFDESLEILSLDANALHQCCEGVKDFVDQASS